jgi:hypothetical protein
MMSRISSSAVASSPLPTATAQSVSPDTSAAGDIYLNVGYVSQLNIGSGDYQRKDPTGCWYASIEMVNFYFEQGPRMGVPDLFTKKVGTFPDGSDMIGFQAATGPKWKELLQNEHMEAIELPSSKAWSIDDLASYLRIYGPLAFAWVKTSKRTGNKYGHISVLIGAAPSTKKLKYHDPENLPNSEMSLSDFNAAFMWKYADGQGLVRRSDAAYRMKNGLTTGP